MRERGKLVGEYIILSKSGRGKKKVKLTPHWEQHRPGWPMLSHVLDELHGAFVGGDVSQVWARPVTPSSVVVVAFVVVEIANTLDSNDDDEDDDDDPPTIESGNDAADATTAIPPDDDDDDIMGAPLGAWEG